MSIENFVLSRCGVGKVDSTCNSLSFFNPEIPEGIFSGDKGKFWKHSTGVQILALKPTSDLI